MAKKKTDDSTSAAPRRSSTTRRRASEPPTGHSIDLSSVTPTGPIDTAADMGGEVPGDAYQPNNDDIARAAYLRYLNRGGADGADFEDWLAAERELRRR